MPNTSKLGLRSKLDNTSFWWNDPEVASNSNAFGNFVSTGVVFEWAVQSGVTSQTTQSMPPRGRKSGPGHPSIVERSFQGRPRTHLVAKTRVRMNRRRSLEVVSISQAIGRLNLFDSSGLVFANRELRERRGRCFHGCDQMMERVAVEAPTGDPGLREQASPQKSSAHLMLPQ
jgi:hypothetical protein